MERRTRLIPDREVLRIVGGSRSTLWLRVKRGEFPGPVKVPGVRACLWAEDDCYAYVNGLIARSGGDVPEGPADGKA